MPSWSERGIFSVMLKCPQYNPPKPTYTNNMSSLHLFEEFLCFTDDISSFSISTYVYVTPDDLKDLRLLNFCKQIYYKYMSL